MDETLTAAAVPALDSATTAPTANLAGSTEQMLTELSSSNYTAVTRYATEHLMPSMFFAAAGLGVIFLGYLCASYISRLISRPVCRRVDETLGKFVGKMVFYTIMFGITGAVLSKLGAPLGGLAAMLAAAGFAVGLAFQGTLSNFAAGVLMLVFRPFKVGDFVNAGGVSGSVNEIDLFTTTLDTPDNRRIVVPNSSIAGGTIENVTFHPHRRVEVLVGVAYSADLDQTRAALEAAAAQVAMATIQGEGRGSKVVLSDLGASSVNWKVRVWVARENFWPIHESLTGEIKRQLDAAGLSIPFPQLDVHLHRDEEDATARPRIRPTRRDGSDLTGLHPISRAS